MAGSQRQTPMRAQRRQASPASADSHRRFSRAPGVTRRDIDDSYVGPDGLIHTKGYPEIAQPSKASRNADLAQRLWNTSVRLTHTDFGVPSNI